MKDTTQIIEELIRKHNIAVAELTEKQLAECIRQAAACGDIIRQVRVTDNAQQIVYIPFAEAEKYKAKYETLLGLVNDMLKAQKDLSNHVSDFSTLR